MHVAVLLTGLSTTLEHSGMLLSTEVHLLTGDPVLADQHPRSSVASSPCIS